MATYTKKLKSITITLIGGTTVSVADTTESADASMALVSFQKSGGAYVEVEGTSTWIPTTSVLKVEVTESEATVEKPSDPFCVESGGGTEKYTIKLCSTGDAPDIYCADSPWKPTSFIEFATVFEECRGDDMEEVVQCIDSLIGVYYQGNRLPIDVSEQFGVRWKTGDLYYKADEATNNMMFNEIGD